MLLFFPAVLTQHINHILLFCHGWGLHSFESLQVEFLRMFSCRNTWCSIIDLQCFKNVARQHSNVYGALSRGQQRCCGSPAPCWLYMWSDLLPGHGAGSWGDHIPHRGTSASWDIAGWSLSPLCGLLVFFSLSEPKLSREMKPSGVFLPHIHQDLKQTNFPNWLVS